MLKPNVRHLVYRLRQTALGINAVLAVFLAGGTLILSNILMREFPLRIRLSAGDQYALSDQTIRLLENIEAQIKIVACFQSDSRYASDVAQLLREYVHVAGHVPTLTLDIEFIDPDRDIARTRELAVRYDLTESNVVVFESGGRRRYVTVDEIRRYEHEVTGPGRILRRYVGFTGEQAFSSALLSVTESRAPVAYFLQGHGEREIGLTLTGTPPGYAGLTRELRRQNVEVRPLILAATNHVPEDCSVLVIAGPTKRIAEAETAMIADYLRRRNGRLLLLIDPRIVTGLEPLLKDWGLELGQGFVQGLSLTGDEVVVTDYGRHAVTRPFNAVMTVFYRPRAVYPADGRERSRPADRAQVTVLARTGPEGWEEFDFQQDPPRYDEDVDRPGPIPLAVAVERGTPDVDIPSTRLVVIGESTFVTDGALRHGGGGNLSFFMCAFNWLAERDALIEIAPRPPYILHTDLTRSQWSRLLVFQTLLLPGAVIAAGACVWMLRR